MFLGCQESPKSVKEKSSASSPIKSVPAPVAKPPPKVETKIEDKLPSSDGRAFDGQWIVILGALDKKSELPKDWAKTQAQLNAVGSKPVSTWSNYFKGLMPCWNIIVGGGFASKDEAKALSKKLKKAGVNNYFKHAGKYVGKDPRVEQACEQTAQFSSRTVPFFPVVQWGDYALVPVAAPKPVLERAMEKAKANRPVDDAQHVWLQALIPVKIGDLSVGKAMRVYAGDWRSSKNCKVKRFVALTWGQPHFSWNPADAEVEGPNCGTPQVMAQLDCRFGSDAEFSIATYPETKLSVVAISDAFTTPVGTKKLNETQRQILSRPEIISMKQAAQKHADESEQQVEVQLESDRLSGPKHVLHHVTYFTGEGYENCGGEDYFERKSAVYRDGQLVAKFANTEYLSYKASIQYDSRDFFLVRSAYGTIFLKDAEGKVIDSINKAFCYCEC